MKGNNAALVVRVLSQKEGWVDVANLSGSANGGGVYNGTINFKWTPCSVKGEFQKLVSSKYMYNHFENHREITRKNELLTNLTNSANYNLENVFDYVPVTMHIFLSAGKLQENLDVALKKFEAVFSTIDIHR